MEREGKQTKNGNGAAAPLIPETAKIMVRSLKEILNCSEEEIYAILKDCDMDPNRTVEMFLDQEFKKSKTVEPSLKEILNCSEEEIHAILKECDMDPNRAAETFLDQEFKKGKTSEVVKMVEPSLKEILNCSEEEIYAILKDCDMNPNRAAEMFLDQDSFQEVKSKRRRRKEMKEALDSISRVHTDVLSHEGKTGSECNVVQVGSTCGTYNESGEATDQGEIGLACSSVTSSMNCVVEENMNSDSFSADNARQSKGRGVSISASEISQGFEPTRVGVNEGNLSMSAIVRMGRPSQDGVSHSEASASASVKLESSSSLHSENQSNLRGTTVSLVSILESDAARYNDRSDNIKPSSVSSQHTFVNNPGHLGQASHSDNNLMNIGSSETHSSFEHCEGSSSHLSSANHSYTLASDSILDVPSAASEFQRLCVSDSKLEEPLSEDNRTVVAPNHIRAFASDWSLPGFGTYKTGQNSSSSLMLETNLSRSGMEEEEAAVDGSSAQNLSARHLFNTVSTYNKLRFICCNSFSFLFYLCSNSVYCGDMQLVSDDHTETESDINYDSLSSSVRDVVNHVIAKETPGHEYPTMSPIPSLRNSKEVTPSLIIERPNLQSSYLSTFPRELHADSNSTSDDMLALLMTPSQLARYSNALSSISNPTRAMPETTDGLVGSSSRWNEDFLGSVGFTNGVIGYLDHYATHD